MTPAWYEVWADETHPIPYLLILRPTPRGFVVIDPKLGDTPVFEAPNYDEVRYWLLEDEFVLVGRKELDD